MIWHLIRFHRIGLMLKENRIKLGYRFKCHTCREAMNWLPK